MTMTSAIAAPPVGLTARQIADYHRDGYLIVERLFDAELCELLFKIGKAESELQRAKKEAGTYAMKDSQGRVSKLWITGELVDDLYSAIARSERVAGPMEQLLGGEIRHFHHKMMQKEPFVGGAWEWHQDYGYWYKQEGFLWPDLASCMIAVDRATRENGCLQVLRGSNRLGRIEHGVTGDQHGADLDRVQALLKHLELVYVELEPGSAVFFHSNTLHRSDQNRSPHPRWSLISCYATAGNVAYRNPAGLRLQKIEPLTDEQIKEIGRRQWASISH